VDSEDLAIGGLVTSVMGLIRNNEKTSLRL